jgi:hypothetical protein
METRAVRHHAWLHTAVQTWLMSTFVFTLTLSLWVTAEADTTYRFTPVELNAGDGADPVVTGMAPSGLFIGSYYDPIGGGVPGFRGLNRASQMLPTLQPQAINAAGTIVGLYWAGGDFGQQVEAGFILSGSAFVTLKLPESWSARANGINQAGSSSA